MGDHEDAAAVGMTLGDPAQRAQDPLLVRLSGLADKLHAVALDGGQPFPGSPVLLPQVRVEQDRQADALGDDLGGLERTGEIAGIDRLELLLRELPGEPVGLRPAEVAERPVGLPLEASVGVPVGFAVANEQEPGHD